jgi:16S rRNA (guanine(966)-N(2))-methyltransferase RsmD
MRIITGSARNAIIETLEGENTRPTAERAKEALFSMIQFELEGRNILDLFAGSGQLGLEALSRGAASCTFIDSAREAVDIVIKNAKNAKLFDRARVSAVDYKAFLKSAAGLFNNRLRGNKIRLPDCKTDRICHFLGFVEHLADRRSSEALCKL